VSPTDFTPGAVARPLRRGVLLPILPRPLKLVRGYDQLPYSNESGS